MTKKQKDKKCAYCSKTFNFEIDGRKSWYKHKYCSTDCSYQAQKMKSKQYLENRKERLIKKAAHIKKSGKISKKCKQCKMSYMVYASQIRHRGSSFCSNKCRQLGKNDIRNKSMKTLSKNAWDMFSKYIRLRDALRTTGDVNYVVCITCNQTKQTKEVDAGHFFSRAKSYIKFDEKNVHAQCKNCNMPPNSGEQYLYSLKIIEMYGQDELDRLIADKTKLKSYSKKDYDDIKNHYKLKVEEISHHYGQVWQGFEFTRFDYDTDVADLLND